MTYDLAIIGGGPAGISAGVYASRKKLKTVFVSQEFGGQSIVSPGIENWIGTVKISGTELAKNLESHLRAYAGDIVDIKLGEKVSQLEKSTSGYAVKTDKNTYEAKAVLITTGSARRKLAVKGADIYEHKGLTYCATCDGPIYSGEDVVVVGGGNAGFESAAQLLAYAKSVTLLHKNNEFKADPVTSEKLKSNPKFRAVPNVEILEVIGERFVKGIIYKDKISGQTTTLSATGIFVEIGATPATDFAGTLIERNEFGAIKVNHQTQATSAPMIWAAGDCTDGLYHQNNISAGDAVKAIEDIYVHLHTK